LFKRSKPFFAPKLPFVEGGAVDDLLFLQLFADAFEPIALGFRPRLACEQLVHGLFHAFFVRHERITECCLADETKDRRGDVTIRLLTPRRLQTAFGKAFGVEQ
jgi:hypothetical protein